MAQDTDVPTMMMRVQTALHQRDRSKNPPAPLILTGMGADEYGIAALRSSAKLVTEFQAGSARPLIGRIIGFFKHLVRRAVRWYIKPIATQQSRFNSALLDVLEKMRSSNERLETEIAILKNALQESEQSSQT